MITIKKAYHGEFKHLLSLIRSALLNNLTLVSFPKKKLNYLGILRQLQLQGYIESFEQRGEVLVIGLKHRHTDSRASVVQPLNQIESVRLNKRQTGTAKQIKKHQVLQGQAVYYAISTDRGLISGLEASSKKIGGIPLFKIY
jgi:ribosomal protein S8